MTKRFEKVSFSNKSNQGTGKDLDFNKPPQPTLFMPVQTNDKKEIEELYEQIGDISKQFSTIVLDRLIRIGEILAYKKAEIEHGEFTPWIKKNCPFDERQARRYLEIFQNRDSLKTDTRVRFESLRQVLEYLKGEKKRLPAVNTWKGNIVEACQNIFSGYLSKLEKKAKVKLSPKNRKSLEEKFHKAFIEAIEEQAKGKTVK